MRKPANEYEFFMLVHLMQDYRVDRLLCAKARYYAVLFKRFEGEL